ncbi:MAG: hypothetical protein HY901_23800 [Deltaproteobacteria bacterium]|nr:hypothetical protein [Deltaproteobacteria bacterium]
MVRRRPHRCSPSAVSSLTAVAASIALVVIPSSATAGTEVFASRRVRVVADQDNQAPREGFITLKVRAENLTSQPQVVHLSFESQPWSVVEAEVKLAAEERRTVPLLLPASTRYGSLGVTDGHEDVRREGFNWHWQSHDPILVERPSEGLSGPIIRFANEGGEVEDTNPTVAVTRAELPDTLPPLVGYAAVGLLATPFEELPEPQRRALEAYAATGGALFLAHAPTRLDDTLPLLRDGRGEGAHAYGLGTVHLCGAAPRCIEALATVGDLKRAAFLPTLAMIGSYRYGQADHAGEPLIDVARVPVGGFLLLVLAFVLVLGPGSFMVRARKGPHALLLFIPLTAMATCGGIAGYGVMHEGLFTLHATSRTVTFLDSVHHRAATQSVDGYYATMAPSEVRYGALAAVIFPQNLVDSASGMRIDESNGMVFKSGFISSRSYREHLSVAVAPSRARLTVRATPQGSVTIENALGAKILTGVVRVGGRSCLMKEIRDGAKGDAICSEGAPSEDVLGEFRSGVGARFVPAALEHNALAPLEEGEFLVGLDEAVFAPDGGLRLTRKGDYQLARGKVSP